MEQILINLNDPSWWFTGIFFILIGLLIVKLFAVIIPKIWSYFSKIIPKFSSRINRWLKLRQTRIVKLRRQHQIRIVWQIGRFWSLFTVFIMYTGFLTIAYLLSKNTAELSKPIIEYAPLVIPVYLFQFLLLWEKSILQKTIKAHIKWNKRITS